MTNKKKIEPAISQHFSKLAKKSWQVRKKKLLLKFDAQNKVEIELTKQTKQ